MPRLLRKLVRPRRLSCASPIFFLMAALAGNAQKVITSQYDNARHGANLIETTLTPSNVNAQHFGKLFNLKVDGDIYAQPLFWLAWKSPAKAATTCCTSPPSTTACMPSMPTAIPQRHCGK